MQIDFQNAINVYISNKNINSRNKLLLTYIPEVKRIVKNFKIKDKEEAKNIFQDCIARLIKTLDRLDDETATVSYIRIAIVNHIKRNLRSEKIETISDENALNDIESEKYNEENIIHGIYTIEMIEIIRNLELTNTEQEAVNIMLEQSDILLQSKHRKALKNIKSKLIQKKIINDRMGAVEEF